MIETVVEMTSIFWRFVKEGRISPPEDSRDIWSNIADLAKQFESDHVDVDWNDPHSRDYYEELEAFATKHFLEKFSDC